MSSSDHRGYATALEAGYLVAITTELSPELVDEGLARELVHLIQTMRRSAGFDISDRIVTWYTGDEQVNRVMGAHKEYIIQETLSLELRQGDFESEAYVEEHIVDGTAVKLGLRRAH